MNVRSKQLKIRNLPQDEKKKDCVSTKPYLWFLCTLIVGISLIFFFHLYLIGGLLVSVSLYYLIFIKNEILVDFYDTFAVFYHVSPFSDDCFLLYWDDVESWHFRSRTYDYEELMVRLKNGKEISLRCACKHKMQRFFEQNTLSAQTLTKQISQ